LGQLSAQSPIEVSRLSPVEIAFYLKANNPRTSPTAQHTTQENDALLSRKVFCLDQQARDPLALGRREKAADGL
jgi:hypothetical protein